MVKLNYRKLLFRKLCEVSESCDIVRIVCFARLIAISLIEAHCSKTQSHALIRELRADLPFYDCSFDQVVPLLKKSGATEDVALGLASLIQTGPVWDVNESVDWDGLGDCLHGSCEVIQDLGYSEKTALRLVVTGDAEARAMIG